MNAELKGLNVVVAFGMFRQTTCPGKSEHRQLQSTTTEAHAHDNILPVTYNLLYYKAVVRLKCSQKLCVVGRSLMAHWIRLLIAGNLFK